MATATTMQAGKGHDTMHRNEKKSDVISANIAGAREVSDMILTSLGPRGMDKMIEDAKRNVIITNDGATILKEMALKGPTAKMMVELSKAQDIAAGDGTTSVVVMAGSLLASCEKLLQKGIHPQQISKILSLISNKALEIIRRMSKPIDLTDKHNLLLCAITSLNSKVVVQNAPQLGDIAVEAVLHLYETAKKTQAVTNAHFTKMIDLDDVKVVSKLGGTIEDSQLIKGLVFTKKFANKLKDAPTTDDKAKSIMEPTSGTARVIRQAYTDVKVGIAQFQISSPKTDMDNTIKIADFQSMDRILKEERKLVARIVKTIAATGCKLLLVQKSVLREAVSDLALDYFTKAGILILRDIDNNDIDFYSRVIGATPAPTLEQFTNATLNTVGLVTEEDIGGNSPIIRMAQCKTKASACTVLVRGSNSLILEETVRSIHDALCVVRSLIIDPAIVPGGGAVEIELNQKLIQWARTLSGKQETIVKDLADAFSIIPYALAENAALPALEIVTQLKKQHALDNPNHGIDVKKSNTADMMTLDIVSPILVFNSAVTLAIETVKTILKIDDIIMTR